MTSATLDWQIRGVAITHPDACRLIDEVQAYYVQIYGTPDETPLQEGYFDAPNGAFFVGYLDGAPVATGAWRFRPDVAAELGLVRPAEIKRMYVVPSAQRRGLAGLMLRHLERDAMAAGATDAILETGAPQAAAVAFYADAGYHRIASFGHYRSAPDNRCFGRSLSAR